MFHLFVMLQSHSISWVFFLCFVGVSKNERPVNDVHIRQREGNQGWSCQRLAESIPCSMREAFGHERQEQV